MKTQNLVQKKTHERLEAGSALPAAAFHPAGSLRTPCLDAHARDRELSPLCR